ncbi:MULTISPECIES: phytoene/squalene synthase family protein [unclassified Streptomyces]|uniref:phytoene/squalene synthase family protein n=1 Tax=unclassified Streptomyces TaxID=2593676 RepID=UPI0036EB7BAC
MSAWTKALDAAGIREPELRSDYDAQRRLVARERRSSYLAARVLLPRPMLPHVMAATAVMHHGDDLLDTGPRHLRVAAWASWERRVREALEKGVADDPPIRAFLHTVTAYPRLREATEEYLATATAELEFTGFTTEADFQAYVDAYSLPAFMLVGTLLGPETDDRRYRALSRTLIEGSQRLDFVNDLAEDLPEGRLGIPDETLRRYSLTVQDLTAGRAAPGVRDLVRDQVDAARTALKAARELPALAAPPGRALLSAVIEIELLTADAVSARGTELLHGSASPPLPGTLRVLWNARRLRRTTS